MLFASVGCAEKTDGENTDDPLISVNITHVPILEEKIDVNGCGYPYVNSLKNLFAVTYNVVRGKIVNYKEILITYTYESGSIDTNYSSLYSIEVEQVYGENDLVYSDNNIIKFFTYDSSNKAFPEEHAANITVGNEYIVFLYDFEKANYVNSMTFMEMLLLK